MIPMKVRLALYFALAAGTLGVTGCRHVNPWERGALADHVMRADRDALGKMMAEHMWFSREAASGGSGVGGGGCGCN